MRWMDAHLEWLKVTHPHTFQHEDGTYWNEGQLRADYVKFCKEQGFCGSERRCGYLCCALPGDTLTSFEIHVDDWTTATQEELIDRGYIQGDIGGMLYQLCQDARDNPAQFDLNEGAGDEHRYISPAGLRTKRNDH